MVPADLPAGTGAGGGGAAVVAPVTSARRRSSARTEPARPGTAGAAMNGWTIFGRGVGIGTDWAPASDPDAARLRSTAPRAYRFRLRISIVLRLRARSADVRRHGLWRFRGPFDMTPPACQ